MTAPSEPSREDDAPEHHVLVDPEHDDGDWAWRRRIRANPTTRRAYRITVGVVGFVVVAVGLVLVPLPGPGWLIVIIGIAVWASEFERAHALLEFVKSRVRAWEEWVRPQPLWLKGLIVLATAAFVWGLVWVWLAVAGVPALLPDGLEAWLHRYAHV